jgi:hypothetical protein
MFFFYRFGGALTPFLFIISCLYINTVHIYWYKLIITIEKLEGHCKNRYQNNLNGRVCVTADSTVLVNQPTSSYGPRNGFARIKIITFACCHFRAPESLDFQGPPLPMALVMALPASKQCKQQLYL